MIQPRSLPWHRPLRSLLPLGLLPALAGCDMVVLNPAGDVARQQADVLMISVGLMLLIIVPVMVLTVWFAWKYRAANEKATYKPDWDHSTGLELIIWSGPLLIVIALGALTWISTHLLDPYRPIGQISAGKPVPQGQQPLEIQVVSLDWKWLFIYPEQGIATVNRLVIPVDRQVRFRLSSSSVMNTFYVPAMAGMIYTMPGMETKLHAVLNRPGTFEGMSAHYSGAGFSYMNFKTTSTDQAGFDRFVAGVKAMPNRLDTQRYLVLERPSEKVAPMGFGGVEQGLFTRIVQMCVKPGTPCMTESMHHGGPDGALGGPTNNRLPPQGEDTKGALEKAPSDYGVSPHSSGDAPEGSKAAPGSNQPGSAKNRNMTRIAPSAMPGRPASAQG
ncbi:cytochrome O ubiquinol oxidase [Sphingomonas sp. Leaf407]|uniref:ubiquinol oxidase subunit II n=1 Tax=unclassified Sphingomonas TaxID=196159 RepID=UPI00070174F4|nr:MULTISPECIES: ubiquinol oxidase subunit II [unclassified Sphingomonas]KQN34790.1 cytochrome O ubiquinol oxidase [Sphingomonas sp. Leaf42]KQT25343.1 cytochrome O ubiquinol oxidase [Sphingomonas sp. Leaf407]